MTAIGTDLFRTKMSLKFTTSCGSFGLISIVCVRACEAVVRQVGTAVLINTFSQFSTGTAEHIENWGEGEGLVFLN